VALRITEQVYVLLSCAVNRHQRMNRSLVARMEAGDFTGALAQVLASQPNTPEGHFRMFNTLSKARCTYLKNPANRRLGYIREIADLAGSLPRGNEDRLKLESLLTQPLATQHQLYRQTRPLFASPEIDQRFKNINPCCEGFSSFHLPPHIFESSQREKRHRRTTQVTSGHSQLTRSKMMEIVAKARATLARDIKTPGSYYEAITAIGVLCGRRNYEIISTLNWDEVPGFAFQAKVSGIAKKGVADFADGVEEFIIPLLCPFELFDDAMTAIRAFRTIDGASDDPNGAAAKVGIRRASTIVFGELIGHRLRRAIYSEVAWGERGTNRFGLDVSKQAFTKLCLCHALVFDQTAVYSAAIQVGSDSEEEYSD
jgi:hypothetical protein